MLKNFYIESIAVEEKERNKTKGFEHETANFDIYLFIYFFDCEKSRYTRDGSMELKWKQHDKISRMSLFEDIFIIKDYKYKNI